MPAQTGLGSRLILKMKKKVQAIEPQLLNAAINEQTNIVISEWKYIITYLDGEKVLLKEVSIKKWENDQIVFERFYYEGIKALN